MLFSNFESQTNQITMPIYKQNLSRTCSSCGERNQIIEFRIEKPDEFSFTCTECIHKYEGIEHPFQDFYKLNDGTTLSKIKDNEHLIVYKVDIPGIVKYLLIRSRNPGSEWTISLKRPSDRQYQSGNSAYFPSEEEKGLIEDAYIYFEYMYTPERKHILKEQFDTLTLWEFMCEYCATQPEERDYKALLEALNKMNLTHARLEELFKQIISSEV